MDAAAYLRKSGWRGAGHSLDHTGRGIVRPLLVSRKVDALGVGKKKTQVADQWWMRAFDESLKELGSGKRTTLSQVRESGVSRGGLYGFFVRGGGLQGTITGEETASTEASSAESSSTKATSFEDSFSDSDSTRTSADESASSIDTSSTDSSSGDSSSTASESESGMASELTSAAEVAATVLAAPRGGRKRKRDKESAAGIHKRRKEERGDKAKDASAPKLPHPSTLEQAEGAEGATNLIHADRLGMINGSGPLARPNRSHATQAGPTMAGMSGVSAPDPSPAATIGRGKLSYKAQKYEREKAKRELKRAERQRLQALVDPGSAPPEREKLAPEDSQEKRREQKEKEKSPRKERVAAKLAKVAEKAKKKAERRESKKQRRAQKLANKAETARKTKELKAEKAKREAAAAAAAAAGGEARPDADVAKDPRPVMSVPAEPLSEEKKQKYAARAAEKGMTVEAYLGRRAQKKAGKAGGASTTVTAQPAEEQSSAGSFVVDTTGDAALAQPLPFMIDTAGDPSILERTKQQGATTPLVWTPDMLGDRKVKELSKEERRARLEWMRARRARRHAKAGEKGMMKKDKSQRRMEKKSKQQGQLMAKFVAQKGKPKGEITKQDLAEAKRQAKRTMRELKREKRNKVIHRGKPEFGEVTKRLNMGGRNA